MGFNMTAKMKQQLFSILAILAHLPADVLAVLPAIGQSLPTACQKMDLAIAIPSQQSDSDWATLKSAMANSLNQLDIGGSGATIRVAVVTYRGQGSAHSSFSFAQYSTKADIVNAVNNLLKISGSGTDVAGALTLISGMFQGCPLRADSQCVSLVIYDKAPDSQTAVDTIFSNFNVLGVQSLYMGLSANLTTDYGGTLPTGSTSTTRAYNSVSDFASKTADAASFICTFRPPLCPVKIDIGFILDQSTSIASAGANNWGFIIQFVGAIINSFPISPTLTRVGMVRFSTDASLTFGFNQYSDASSLINVVNNLQLQGGEANYAQAYRVANSQLFSQRRPNVKTICIMITDGHPNIEIENTFTGINVTKAAGIEIFAIGVTNNVDQVLLRQVASQSEDGTVTNFYFANDFSSLSTIISTIIDDLKTQSCSVSLQVATTTQTTTPTTTTTTPTTTLTTQRASTPTISPVPSGTIDVIGKLYGPLAGGTRFTLVGDSLTLASTNVSIATISTVYIGVYTATVVNIASGKLQVTTSPANRTGFEVIILGTVGGQLLDTRRTFEYRNNTWVNDMQPRQYIFDGGTVTSVTGTNIDSVAEPGISITIVITRWEDTNVTESSNTTDIESCFVVDSTRMRCVMPVVPIPPDFSKNDTTDSNVPGVAAFIGPNGKDRADVYIGLILDGDVAYANISSRLPNVKVSFFERPPLDCSQTNAKFNPKSDTSIAIKGSSLTRGNRLIDIKVTVGVGVCNVTQLTDNEIVCKPPVEVPNKGNNTLCSNDGPLPVEVFIGFAEYHCSCLQYDLRSSNVPLIVGLVVGLGGGLVVIAIVIAVLLVYRRRRIKKHQHTVNENSRTYVGAYSISIPHIELDTFSGDYSTNIPSSES